MSDLTPDQLLAELSEYGNAPGPWVADALCAQVDPELFYGHPGNARAAARVCQGCPVRQECRDYALSLPAVDDWGTWGGMGQEARRKARRVA